VCEEKFGEEHVPPADGINAVCAITIQTTKRELTAHSRYLMQRRPTSRCVAAILPRVGSSRAQMHNERSRAPSALPVNTPIADADVGASVYSVICWPITSHENARSRTATSSYDTDGEHLGSLEHGV